MVTLDGFWFGSRMLDDSVANLCPLRTSERFPYMLGFGAELLLIVNGPTTAHWQTTFFKSKT